MLETFHDVEQGGEAWHSLRCGLPTASRFKDILAKSADLKMRNSYRRMKAAEILTGRVEDSYRNGHMDRGNEQEPWARATYGLTHNVDVVQVGFTRDLEIGAGASPDGIIGDDGVVEFKSVLPSLLIEAFEADKFPSQHLAQAQGVLLITGRAWCDVALFSPGLPLFVRRTMRDVDYLATLRKEIASFNFEVQQTVKYLRSFG